MIVWTNEWRDTSHTSTRLLCSYKVDLEVGTLEDTYESNLMVQRLIGASRYSELEPHIRLYTFMSSTPRKKIFLTILMNELNAVIMIHFLLLLHFSLCYISLRFFLCYVTMLRFLL